MALLMEVKCPRCGRVHMRVSRQQAEESIARNNASLSPEDTPARYESFLSCFRCGAPASTFVSAGPDDAPTGVTLTCVVCES